MQCCRLASPCKKDEKKTRRRGGGGDEKGDEREDETVFQSRRSAGMPRMTFKRYLTIKSNSTYILVREETYLIFNLFKTVSVCFKTQILAVRHVLLVTRCQLLQVLERLGFPGLATHHLVHLTLSRVFLFIYILKNVSVFPTRNGLAGHHLVHFS